MTPTAKENADLQFAYAWADDVPAGTGEIGCLLFAADLNAVALRANLTVPGQPAQPATHAASGGPVVGVTRVGTGSLAWEPTGWALAHAGALSTAVPDGRGAAVYWNVNAVDGVLLSVDGQTVFDSERPAKRRADVQAMLDGVDFDSPRSATLAVASAWTGQIVELVLFPTISDFLPIQARVSARAWYPKSASTARMLLGISKTTLEPAGADLVTAVQSAPENQRRRLALWCLDRMMEQSHLAEDTVTAAAYEAFRSGAPLDPRPLEALFATVEQDGRTASEIVPDRQQPTNRNLWDRLHTLEALREMIYADQSDIACMVAIADAGLLAWPEPEEFAVSAIAQLRASV